LIRVYVKEAFIFVVAFYLWHGMEKGLPVLIAAESLPKQLPALQETLRGQREMGVERTRSIGLYPMLVDFALSGLLNSIGAKVYPVDT
jgi:hypothetical protein